MSGGCAPHPVLLGAAARVPAEPRRTPGAPCRGGWPALLHCSVTDAAVSKNHEGKKGGEEEESLRGDARGRCRLCRVPSKPGSGGPGAERTRWLPGAVMSPDPAATNCCQCTGLIRGTRERGEKKKKKIKEKNKRKILESLFFSSLFAWVFGVPVRAGAAAGQGLILPRRSSRGLGQESEVFGGRGRRWGLRAALGLPPARGHGRRGWQRWWWVACRPARCPARCPPCTPQPRGALHKLLCGAGTTPTGPKPCLEDGAASSRCSGPAKAQQRPQRGKMGEFCKWGGAAQGHRQGGGPWRWHQPRWSRSLSPGCCKSPPVAPNPPLHPVPAPTGGARPR